MSFRDAEFQQHMCVFVCRDRNFLRRVGSLLDAKDYKPRPGEGPELYWIARESLQFWRDYGEPIGGLLRTHMLDYCRTNNVSKKSRAHVLEFVRQIKRTKHPVAVEALEQKIKEYKARRAKFEAIQELVKLQERGKLTDGDFVRITEEALMTYNTGYLAMDYFEDLEARMGRRRAGLGTKWPVLLIDPLDAMVKNIRRKGFGLVLGLYKMGKSFLLIWIAMAYALQGFSVLFFTLEDPLEEVTDRLDAAFTDLPIRGLPEFTKKLRRRFEKAKERVRAKIKIVDATEGGWTVARIRDAYDRERNRGFAADVVIIDYDDELVPSIRRQERRFEFADIYRDLRKFAAGRDIFLWTAAQAKRGAEDKQIVTGGDTAEDISKPRKVHFAVSIGMSPDEMGSTSRHLHIIGHKHDKQGIGCDIYTRLDRGIFYDRERTVKRLMELRTVEDES